MAILGAGELGATIARRLAERAMARRVVLVDADGGKARGKALDILQAGPLEGYDTRVEGCAALDPDGATDVLVVRVLSVVEVALEPVDRVAFDTAAQRRFEGENP